jgi:hypothetical protein
MNSHKVNLNVAVQHFVQQLSHTKENGMKTTGKGPKAPVTSAVGEKFDVLGSVSEVYTKSIEQLAGMQKQGLEFAVQQNADLIGIWKKNATGSAAASGFFMFDLMGTLFERYAETQKGAIDLVVDQTHAFASAVKESKAKVTKAAEEGVKLAEEAIEQSIAVQKTALDYSAKQTKEAFESAKKQFGYAGTPAAAAADSVQRGVEVVIEAQKNMLDVLKSPIQFLH